MNLPFMSGTDTTLQPVPPLDDVLADIRSTAREQLAGAFQLHVERVQEELQRGWADHIERVVEDRFGDLLRRAQEQLDRALTTRVDEEVAARLEGERETARRQRSEDFNRSARRLVQSANVQEWSRALLDATRELCFRAALFSVAGDRLRCEGVRAPEEQPVELQTGVEFATVTAPAFAAAIDGKETLVVVRSVGELGETLGRALPADNEGKAFLFPLIGRQKVVAVLYGEAGAEPVDVNGLELITAVAAKALEAIVQEKRPAGLVSLSPSEGAKPAAAPVALSKDEQDVHSRAQRFARVQVAEMRLYKSGAVKAGRAESRLYDALRQDIDSGREAFYRQFIASSPSMVDYFHLELVRTLANEDPTLLGPDYPGPLV
jgi:hypothetical protein